MINTEHVETAVLWWEPWTPVQGQQQAELVHHHNQKLFFCYTAIHSEMVININTHL